MKSVIKSLHPEVCERIASGEQTIIVAKSAPKEVPFKAYIYETKARYKTFFDWNTSDGLVPIPNGGKVITIDKTISRVVYNRIGRGKVIGEFICDKVDRFDSKWSEWAYAVAPSDIPCDMPMSEEKAIQLCKEQAFLTDEDIVAYFGDEDWKAAFWHISDLKIYDKPKELKEFYTRRSNKNDGCDNCINKKFWKKETEEIAKSICGPCQKDNFKKEITHAPQSWLYAEKFSLYKGKVIDEPNEWVRGELKKYGEACYIKQTVEPTNSNCGIGTFQVIPETVVEIN